MSLSLTQVQQTEFENLVKLEYQSAGFKLKKAVRYRGNVEGAFAQFRKAGQIVANETGYQSTVPIQDPGYAPFTAQLKKYTAGSGVDTVQELTVNFDAKMENAKLTAMALGRRSDQIIINALRDSGTPNIIPAAGANMSYEKMKKVREYFDDFAVPIEERYIAMSANNLSALLADDRLLSRFYTENKAVETGALRYTDILSMNVIIIPAMIEGGLPKAGNIRTAFAWHSQSTGMAVGLEMKVEVNYLPRETTFFVNGIMFAGAIAVDTKGIVSIACDETVNP